ncbi:hypothetical protein Bca52824_016972 [Brassica carinata]|uniref:Myb/SANT-like domain-containing protein n=1 Tax=Brassica carinata TaxID=52824 RepID=A0A8X7VM61_BRACI|nr:hypothetical protein Bca52824_016972 [Brassica carinata]
MNVFISFISMRKRKKKGNKTKAGINQTGKEFIINKFEERFGKRHVWERFKNKYDISRKAYMKFKRLIHNRTGMGYDSMGRIDMSDDWWEARIAEWPKARKYKNKLIPNMDVFEAEFGAITVTGAEGWSAQQGEASLGSRMGVDSEDDSVPVDMDISEHMGETSNRGGCRKKAQRDGSD